MPPALIYKNAIGGAGFILVEDEAIGVMHLHRQSENNQLEAGGILIGYRRGPHIHIVEATQPQLSDRRHRYHFFRNSINHYKVAIARWESSDRRLDYVGEWHTHPEVNPTPSLVDISEWRKIVSHRKIAMVFIVVGTESEWIGVGRTGRGIERFVSVADA